MQAHSLSGWTKSTERLLFTSEGRYFVLKKYNDALADVNEALEIENEGADAANARAERRLSPSTASLLVLRGRILDAQGSPNAREDWQQVKGLRRRDTRGRRLKCCLVSLTLHDFEAARAFFEGVAIKNSTSPLYQYDLGCFYAASRSITRIG